jgi:hypothetical protein
MAYFATQDLPATNNVMGKRFNDYRRTLAAHMIDDSAAMYHGNYVDQYALQRHPNDPAQNLMLAARSGDRQLENYLKSSIGKKILAELDNTRDDGFFKSAVVSTMYDAITFDFYPESGRDENHLALDLLLQGDIAHVYDGQVVSPDVTLADVAMRRRELGTVDLSKQHLDNRVALLINAMNTEYSFYAMSALRDMSCMGGTRSARALELYATYKDVLTDVHMPAKCRAMAEIGSAYREFAFYARGGRNAKTAKIFDAMSDRALSYYRTMRQMTATMLQIYDSLGYEVPPGLQAFRTPEQSDDETDQTQEHAEPPVTLSVEYGPNDLHEAEEMPAVEVPEEQVALHGTADAIAKKLLEGLMVEQLDEVLLPTDPEKFRDQLKEAIAKTSRGEEVLRGKVWEKVIDIATVCVEHGGKMYRSKRGGVKAEDIDRPGLTDDERERLRRRKSPPYFVAVFERPGSRAALAETEEYGYSTKFVDEASLSTDRRTTWLDALTLDYEEAKRIGVQRILHSRGDNHFGAAHQHKMRAILERHGYDKKIS